MKNFLFAALIAIGIVTPAYASTILFPSGGGTGISTNPTYGQVLVGNSGGTYTLTATSSLGVSSASSTLLTDANIFSGVNSFTNSSSNWAGTWQTYSPSHFQVAGTYVTSVGATYPILSSGGTTPTISTALSTTTTLASGSTNGFLSSTDWTTFNNKLSGNQTITLSGAVSGSGATSITTSYAGILGNTLGGTNQDSHTWNGIAAVNNGVWSSLSTSSMNASITGNAGSATTLTGVLSSSLGGAGSVSGILKANGSGTVSAASNGTDFSLITANTCGSGHFSSVTAAGVFTCTADSGSASSTLLTDYNTWTNLQKFANATSTLFTSTTAWVGTLNLTNPLSIANGGTGITSVGASSTVATTDGTAIAWQKVSLASAVYGTLPIGNGGTNATSFTTSGNAVYYTGSALATAPTGSAITIPYASTTALSVNGDTTTGKRYLTFTYATSTAWTGTTTPLFLGAAPVGLTLQSVQCSTDAGTVNVAYQYGTGPTSLAYLNASTTIGTFTWSANNTPAAGNLIEVYVGTPASSPTQISCTVTAKQT